MTRMWGRAPRGERICEATPQGRWEVLTTLVAMSLRGIDAAMTIASATDGEVFKGYLEPVYDLWAGSSAVIKADICSFSSRTLILGNEAKKAVSKRYQSGAV